MLDRQHPALYNQAIMDFGALLCKPTSPLCDTCPLSGTCQALKEHLTDKLPIKSKRTAVRDRYLTYIYTRTKDGQTLLRRRGSGDIWQGLFEFPLIESDRPLTMEEVEKTLSNFCPPSLTLPNCSASNRQLPLKGENKKSPFKGDLEGLSLIARDVRHQLTHQRLHADFYCLTLPHADDEMVNGKWSNGKWIKESDLDRYALPRLLEKLLEKL